MKIILKCVFVIGFLFLTSYKSNSQTAISVGTQISTFNGNIRGYHFTAPTNFTICGLQVPPDASTALQTVRVVVFNAGAPPAFPGGTNSVTQLFSATNVATGVIPCNIPVTTGQIIGVYGARGGCVNSYGPANFVTSILGFNTTLQRSGMQSCPAAGVPMSNIWSEVANPIGRITMYINCCATPTVTTTSNAPICPGQTLQLTGTATPAGTYTYNWVGPNGFTSTVLSPSVPNISSTGAGVYTLTVVTPACGNVVSPITVVVNPTPTLNVTPTTVCLGTPATLTATSNVPNGVFTWSLGGVTVGTGPTLTVNPTVLTTYSVGYSVNGCTPVSTNVTVNVAAIPTVTTSSATICAGQQGSITATGLPSGGTYDWTSNAITVGTAATLSVSPLTTTNYSLVYTLNGCPSPPSASTITVNSVQAITGNLTLCAGATTQLSNASAPALTNVWSSASPAIATINASGLVTAISSGTAVITYTSIDGCTATATITVNAKPILTVTPSNILCNGGTGSVVLSATSGLAPYTYGGSPTSALLPGLYTYTATSSQGCVSTPVSITITQPSAPLTLSTSQTNVLCFGFNTGSINLTPSGGTGPYSYLWSNSAITQDISNLLVGTYSVAVTDANGCTANIATTLTGPAAPLSVTIPDALICSTQNYTFNPQFSTPGGQSVWSTSQTTSSITVSPVTTTTYTIAYTLNTCVALDTAIVTVIPTPTLSVNSTAICLGDSAQITSTTNLVGGTYQWSNGLTTPNITVTPAVNPTVYTLIYSLNGCSSIPATSTITVYPIPQLTVAPATICFGQNATLVATPNLPGGTYSWLTGGETTPSITVSPALSTTYSVLYTLNGCVSNQANGILTVNPLPNATIQSDVVLGCSPLVVNFTADTTGQVATYQWSTNNGGVGSGVNAAMSFTNTGCYNVTLVATMLGCVTTNTQVNYICVVADPVANFSASINTFTEDNQNVLFNNSSTGASTYSWDFGDGNSSNDENPSHVYGIVDEGETITLLAYSSLGCMDSLSITIPFQESELFYIPNTFTPDGNMYNETFVPQFTTGFDIYSYHMEIFNRWGELIFETFNLEHGWDGSYGLEGLDAVQGTYTYKISIKSPSVDKRMVYTGHVNLIR